MTNVDFRRRGKVMFQRFIWLIALLLSANFLLGCGAQTKNQRKFSREQTAAAIRTIENEGLVIGEFPLRSHDPILDGDTVMVQGLDSSLRLIGIDTEETFKKERERQLYAGGFEKYKKTLRGDSKRPVKMATPLGEEAKQWAQQFFDGVSTVRLERDHPAELRGFYGRYLAYVFAQKDGKWVNYNIECVRAGMSPYYMKYAHSRRFHQEFLEAEAQAKAQQIGIWDPNKESYGDYDERKAWWGRRAAIIDTFEREEKKHDNYFALTRYNAMLELDKRVGQEVVVFGAIGNIRHREKGPSIVKLSRSRTESFDVVFFEKDVLRSLNLDEQKGEYIFVRGMVRRYKNKYNGRESLQIIVNFPSQVWVPSDEALAGKEGMPTGGATSMVSAPVEVVQSPVVNEQESSEATIDLDAEMDSLYKDDPAEEMMSDTESADSNAKGDESSDLDFDGLM
ncbi:MAG: thermonuclease family protein [Myxococcaceae bacterium]|nr:thermonuclease family protein [Myxococcaceae bacterium]